MTAALAVAALLLAGACSDDESGPLDTITDDKPPPAECLASSKVPKNVDAKRPAVAIKVENDPAARPLSGLEDADVVYEEVVEGGITRFMAIYHCGESKRVGSVRSARFDDPKIALPFTRILAFSGSNTIVGRELKRQGITTLVEGMKGTAFYRVPPGSPSVHSVFADTEKLRDFAARKATPPNTNVFPRGDLPDGLRKASSVKINFERENTIEYQWKNGSWMRFEGGQKFTTRGHGQIGVPNLLIQEVEVDNSNQIVDVEGNPSPDINLLGKGKAVLFREGSAQIGEWNIAKEAGPPTFTSNSGRAFSFADGPVWVELVPSKKGEVKGSFSFK